MKGTSIQPTSPELLDSYFQKIVTDAQDLANKYSLKVEKQIIKSEQLKLLELQEQEKKSKEMLEKQQSAIDRMLSESSLHREYSAKEVPPVVERLLEVGEHNKQRLAQKQRQKLERELEDLRRTPEINKNYHSANKPIYERYPEVIRNRVRKMEDLQSEVQFEMSQKDPDLIQPAFQPNIQKSNASFTFRKHHINFFSFLNDVKRWQEVKEKKIQEKQKIAKMQEVSGFNFHPQINERSRKIILKKHASHNLLDRMGKFDAKSKLNKTLLSGSMQLTHSPSLHSKFKQKSPNAHKYSKKDALDRSSGYIPYLKADKSAPNIFSFEKKEDSIETPTLRSRKSTAYEKQKTHHLMESQQYSIDTFATPKPGKRK